MEKSMIYDLLDGEYLQKWEEEIKKREQDNWVFTRADDALKALEAELNEKNKKLLASYTCALSGKLDFLYYNLNIKFLNFGIKMGMEMQKAFTEQERLKG